MRIEFTQTGGIGFFPGLNKPVSIEVEQLDSKDSEELRRLVEASRFFALPASVGTLAPGMADYQHYVLTIADQDRTSTVRILVPVTDPMLLELVHAVQKHVKAALAKARAQITGAAGGKPR